jgi:hypothetical protein
MHTVTRAVAAAALAVTSALSIGIVAATAAQAGDRVHMHAAPVARTTALPELSRLTGAADGVAPPAVEVAPRCTRAGATGWTASGGAAASDQALADAAEVTPDPSSGERGAAGIAADSKQVHAGGTGTWSMLTGSPGGSTSMDPAGGRGVSYHVVEPEDVRALVASARCAGTVARR